MSEALVQPAETLETYSHRYDEFEVQGEANKAQYPHFPTPEEVRAEVAQTTQLDLVTRQPNEAYRDGTTPYPTIVRTPIAPEVLRAAFSGTDQELDDLLNAPVWPNGIQITDPRLNLPGEVREQVLQDAHEQTFDDIAKTLGYKQLWWADSDAKLREDVQEGRVSEWYEITKGDKSITMFNCDRPMTDDEVEELRGAVEHMATATKDQVFDRLHVLALQHNDRFGTMKNDPTKIVVGKALPNNNRMFRLNTILRDLGHLRKPEDRGNFTHATDESEYVDTFVHEIGHLFDPNGGDNEAWAKLDELETGFEYPLNEIDFAFKSVFAVLGWTHRDYKAHDAEGNEIEHTVRGIADPSEEIFVVRNDGSEEKIKTHDEFTDEEVSTDLPISPYANTNGREDFAETFMAYCLEGPEAVGPLRRAVLEHTMNKLVAFSDIEYDPHSPVIVTKRSLTDLPTTIPAPEKKTFAVFVDSLKGWRKQPDWHKARGLSASASEGYYE